MRIAITREPAFENCHFSGLDGGLNSLRSNTFHWAARSLLIWSGNREHEPHSYPDVMAVAIYPGSFDPLTNGHLDILTRGSHLFDQLIVAVLQNSQKQSLFAVAERVEMLNEATAALPNVSVLSFEGLLVNCARECGAQVIVRGLRSPSDYEFEEQLATLNRRLSPQLDTIFLVATESNRAISSRIVKEIASLGGDVTSFVPPHAAAALRAKYASR